MKKMLTCAAVTLLTGMSFGQTVEDANIMLGNLPDNLYWTNYNDNTKIVSGLYFSVFADGTNSSNVTPPFTIKVYIWDGSNPTFVQTYNDAGIYHFGGREYADQTIDLTSLGLPAGSYRLGVFVDADDDISSSADDPSDNAYLAANNINFTPGGSSAGITENKALNTLMVFPNPVTDKVTVAWEKGNTIGVELIEIMDLNGQVVKTMSLESNQTHVNLNVTELTPGLYIVALHSANGKSVQKFMKQ